jgi:hypothetical protein
MSFVLYWLADAEPPDGARFEALASAPLDPSSPWLASLPAADPRGALELQVNALGVIAQVHPEGLKPADAEQRFGVLLDTLGELRQRHGGVIWSDALARPVDLADDREMLARTYLEAMADGARRVLEQTREGRAQNVIALVMLFAVALAGTYALPQLSPIARVLVALALATVIVALIVRLRRGNR